MRGYLWILFGIAFAGLCFSGYLSYAELTGSVASTCPTVGQPGTVFGQPACIYGFFMYLALVVVSVLGLRRGTHAPTSPSR